MLLNRAPQPEFMMREDERQAYEALPDRIELFRGYGADHPERSAGLSWSTDRNEAIRMAYDYHGAAPCLVTGACDKKDALGYFLRRHEFEILIDPNRVTLVSDVPLSPRGQPGKDATETTGRD